MSLLLAVRENESVGQSETPRRAHHENEARTATRRATLTPLRVQCVARRMRETARGTDDAQRANNN